MSLVDTLPDKFYIDAAIGALPWDELAKVYDIPPEAGDELTEDPVFQRRLLDARVVVEADGTAFSARCRLIAGNTLPEIERIIKDTMVPAATRLTAFSKVVQLGKLEPKPEPVNQTAGGPGLSLTIVTADGVELSVSTLTPKNAERPVIEHEPASVEEDDSPPNTRMLDLDDFDLVTAF
jgi:hypothetical protein